MSKPFTLDGVLENMRCPYLICHGGYDGLYAGRHARPALRRKYLMQGSGALARGISWSNMPIHTRYARPVGRHRGDDVDLGRSFAVRPAEDDAAPNSDATRDLDNPDDRPAHKVYSAD